MPPKPFIYSEHADEVRTKYIELLAETKEQKSSENSSSLYSIYKKTNLLLPSVKTPPELLLDACVSGEIVDISDRRLSRLCSGDKISVDEYLSLFCDYPRGPHSEYVISMFRGSKIPNHLSIEGEEEIRERRERKREKTSKECNHPQPSTPADDQSQKDIISKVKKICEVLDKYEYLPLFSLVLHPNDFSKTVENLLTLSFAVKLERAFIHKENDTVFVSSTRREYRDSHCVITITKEEAETLIKSQNISHPLLD